MVSTGVCMPHPWMILLLLLLLPVAGGELRAQQSPPPTSAVGRIARQQSRAVVVLEALDIRGNLISQGSGFIVTRAGAIVTSLHVLRAATAVRVRLTNGDIYMTSDVVEIDELKDIAIIRIKGFELPVVALGNSDVTEIGEEVVVISSPEGLTNSVSTGIVSGMRQLDTHRVFQISAPISQGSSGGAIFNSRGEVIGIATYVLRSGQNINFAVPINYARGMIADQSIGSLATVLARIENSRPPTTPPTTPLVERETDSRTDELYGQLSTAARGRRGRTALDPLYPRPDEALALFYRFVDGIGLLTATDIDTLTRAAAVDKTDFRYTIRFLSYQYGVALTFSQPDRILTSVDMLVNWSVDDLRNTFGDKFKRRTIDNQRIIDYGQLETGRLLLAILDNNGNVRTIRFTRPAR